MVAPMALPLASLAIKARPCGRASRSPLSVGGNPGRVRPVYWASGLAARALSLADNTSRPATSRTDAFTSLARREEVRIFVNSLGSLTYDREDPAAETGP